MAESHSSRLATSRFDHTARLEVADRKESYTRPAQPPGHTHLVRLLKIALPVTALAIIITMAIYSLLYRADGTFSVSYSDRNIDEGRIVMEGPRFIGSDTEGRTFEVVAVRATQDAEISTLVTLEEVIADVMIETGLEVEIAAKLGELDTRNELLALSGPITLKSSDGYNIRTSEVKVDLARGTLKGRSPIEADGPFGTLYADGFEVDRNDKRVRFLGSVRIQITPKTSPPDDL